MIETADLKEAERESWYWIGGTGGDLNEWVVNYEKAMAENGIGKPAKWAKATGAQINDYAHATCLGDQDVAPLDRFPDDLACLLFPLDGLHVGLLAMFKMQMQDRWFDDVIQNMRRDA